MSTALKASEAVPYFSPYVLEKLHEAALGRQDVTEADSPDLRTAFTAYRKQLLGLIDHLQDAWASVAGRSGLDRTDLLAQCQTRMDDLHDAGQVLAAQFGSASMSSRLITADLLSLRNIQQSLEAVFSACGAAGTQFARSKAADLRPPLLLGGAFLVWGQFMSDMTGALAGVNVAASITRDRAEAKRLTLHQGGRNPMLPPGIPTGRLALVAPDSP